MIEEILCIDGKFSPQAIEFYNLHKVVTPKEDKLYTIRDVIKHALGDRAGKTGILLNELVNPTVPVIIPPLGETQREPTWDIKRFAHLNGTVFTEDEVRELIQYDRANKLLNL